MNAVAINATPAERRTLLLRTARRHHVVDTGVTDDNETSVADSARW
jgi:hypothetical protein